MALRYVFNDTYYNWRDEDISHMRKPQDRHVLGNVEKLYGPGPRRPTWLWKGRFIGTHSLRDVAEYRT